MSSSNGPQSVTNEMSASTSSTMTTRSVSDHTIKTSALLEETSISRLNGNCEPTGVVNGHRMPSYVGISCAISGYSDYNRYCSSVRNSSTRRDISGPLREPMHRPVNHLNDSLNRKNSLISEALITSRHDVSEDIEVNGSYQSIDPKNNSDITSQLKDDLNNDMNKNNSLLEQRIASLYGERFANDWRESRTKTRSKLKNSALITKQRSPSCPPTQKQTQMQTKSSEHPTHDNKIDTHSKLISDRQSISNERVEQLEQTNCQSSEVKAAITETETETAANNVNDNQLMASQHISNNEIGCNGSKGYNGSDTSNGSIGSPNCAQSNASDTSAKDGKWFINELNKTTEEIKSKIDLTEGILAKEDSLMGEEIAGKLRAAIGKANLLINKKFKQFRELCLKNISQPECDQFVTTNDDLQGFWDMMSFQVTHINDTFDEIWRLRDIGWQTEEICSPKKPTQTPTKVRSRKSTPKGSPDKSSDESTANRDSERRNRLREAKRKARLKATQNEDEITIFIPSNKE